jgi:hypothetical protein
MLTPLIFPFLFTQLKLTRLRIKGQKKETKIMKNGQTKTLAALLLF